MKAGLAVKGGGLATLGIGGGVGIYCATREVNESIEGDLVWGEMDSNPWPNTADTGARLEDLDRMYYAYKYLYPEGKYLVKDLNSFITDETNSCSSNHVKQWCDKKKSDNDITDLEKTRYWCTKKKIGDSYTPSDKWWNDSSGDFSDDPHYKKISEGIERDEEEKKILAMILKKENSDSEQYKKGYTAYFWCRERRWSIVEDESNLPVWVNVYKDTCLIDRKNSHENEDSE